MGREKHHNTQEDVDVTRALLKFVDLFDRTIRNIPGTSQVEVAEVLNETRATLSNYMSGRTYPRIDTIIRFCLHFQISLDRQLGLDTRGGIEISSLGLDIARKLDTVDPSLQELSADLIRSQLDQILKYSERAILNGKTNTSLLSKNHDLVHYLAFRK